MPEEVMLETEESLGATDESKTLTYTPDKVSQLLHMFLLQAITKTLGSLSASAYPIPAMIFYTTHILPN